MRQENKNKKMRNSIIVMSFLLSLILLTASVSALKIAPAIKSYNYDTMKNIENYEINILEHKGKIEYSLDSENADLLKYVNLKKVDDKILVTVNKPNNILEGNNLINILVKESSNNNDMFSSNIILKSKLNIYKPVQGAFLESNYVVQNNDFDDPIIFTISLENKGTIRTKAFGNVIIENTEGAVKKIHEEILLDEISLDIGEKGKIAKTWNHDMRRGSYESNATLYYEGKQKSFEKQVLVGKPTILFNKVELNTYDKNGISKINAEIKLDWNFGKEVFLEINNNPGETKAIDGYETSNYDLYAENINEENLITITAKDKEGNSLGKYEINPQDLIKKYEQKRFWKLMILFSTIIIILILTTIKILKKREKEERKRKERRKKSSLEL